jgi:Leucine-rich repeat (LRR) protein
MSSNAQFELQPQTDSHKLKEFKLTFEHLTSLQGIQRFPAVEYVALQYNMIKHVKELSACPQVIELNLSNNAIKDVKPLALLSSLRYLNLANNKLS